LALQRAVSSDATMAVNLAAWKAGHLEFYSVGLRVAWWAAYWGDCLDAMMVAQKVDLMVVPSV